jgi:hypothetical protein
MIATGKVVREFRPMPPWPLQPWRAAPAGIPD